METNDNGRFMAGFKARAERALAFARERFERDRFSIVRSLRRQEAFGLGAIALVLASAFTFMWSADAKGAPVKESIPVAAPAKAPDVDHFAGIRIGAESAFVLDINTNAVLYARNAKERHPLASITKVAMAVTAADILPRQATVTVRQDFLDEEGDTGLFADESWRFRDLLDYSLVVSSNDGASAIAAAAGSFASGAPEPSEARREFVVRMNKKMRQIGLADTTFDNETGLDTEEGTGGYGTAEDVARLFAYALRNYPELLEATRYESVRLISLDNIRHVGRNTNQAVGDIPGLIASKTGYTDKSGGNLAVAFDAGLGRPVVVVVLGSTYDGRFDDVRALAQAALKEISDGGVSRPIQAQ